VAAELPRSFLEAHGRAVTVENHLNMIVPVVPEPLVSTRALSAFLNSAAADRAFRCISGTVAVSAYELEAIPLPPPWTLRGLDELLSRSHSQQDVEDLCRRLYGSL
jgi:adenine-specific DNA-methyltransferase